MSDKLEYAEYVMLGIILILGIPVAIITLPFAMIGWIGAKVMK